MTRKPIYIETSVWSAVIDPRIARRQAVTRRFLRRVSRKRRLLVSDLALAELDAHPKKDLRKGILRYLRRMRPRVLGLSARIRLATEELMEMGGWGKKAIADVTQLGYALCGGAEAFATWNQKDLARESVREVVGRLCTKMGRPEMKVGTPSEVAQWLGIKM